MFIALVLVLGIACPFSAFALAEADTDALAGAPVAQEQSIVLDTAQNTKQSPDNSSEALETSSNEVVEPSSSNLDSAISVDKGGQKVISEPSSDPEDASMAPTQTAELPALTGYVFISGSTKVGATLSATVEGAPRSATLSYQWYRGDTAIEGATSTNYVLVSTDVGQPITCKVTAENYRGVLISSALILNDQLVTVEYWAYTDASPDQEVIVHTKTALLSDMFDPTFDPNKDDDPLNDWMGYRFTGWWDEGWAEPYSISAPQEEAVTLGELAHRAEWDGVSPIRVYADYLLRYIEVTYHTNGYADEYFMETVQLIAWIEAPYQDIYWPGYEFLGIMDECCNYIDETMTCGDILQGLAEMSFTDSVDIREYLHSVETLDLYFDWYYRQYEVYFISPESTYVQSCGYYEDLVLAVAEKIDGYEFVGWFTEPDGQGTQVIDKMKYAMFEQDEMVMSRNLYAYYIPKT